MSILSWLLFLIVAAVCAWIAECVVPNKMPGGFIASALMGSVGPSLAGVALLPTIVGSAILVFGSALLSSVFRGKGTR